jgi:stage II sporulation protein GA (sporulation sigma-E factor processing peptidase)
LYLEVYPDVIFVLNFFLDSFLLYLLVKVNRKRCNIPRLLAGACMGGIFAVINAVFPWMNAIVHFILMYIVASALMIWVLFGKQKWTQLLRQIVVLFVITYFIGGVINSIYYHTNFRLFLLNLGNGCVFSSIRAKMIGFLFLVTVPVVLFVLRFLQWYRSNFMETYEVELVLFGHSIHTTGFLDSGNCLYDPVYKNPVMVVDSILMQELLPPQLWREIEKAKGYDFGQWNISREQLIRLRFIPYQSIGKKGVLIGIKLDKVMIHSGNEIICRGKVIAAISENDLSSRENYHVILHRGLL